MADTPRRTAQSIADERQKRDNDVMKQIARERETLEAKVARLRALRLAKEAEERTSAAVPVARKPRPRRAQG